MDKNTIFDYGNTYKDIENENHSIKEENKEENKIEQIEKPKPFKCEICGKAFES